MLWGSFYTGYHEAQNQTKQQRLKVALAFERFKRNNPEATFEDFNDFLNQVAGPNRYLRSGYSDSALRALAADNAKRKQIRLTNEQNAQQLQELKIVGEYDAAYDKRYQAVLDGATDADTPDTLRRKLHKSLGTLNEVPHISSRMTGTDFSSDLQKKRAQRKREQHEDIKYYIELYGDQDWTSAQAKVQMKEQGVDETTIAAVTAGLDKKHADEEAERLRKVDAFMMDKSNAFAYERALIDGDRAALKAIIAQAEKFYNIKLPPDHVETIVEKHIQGGRTLAEKETKTFHTAERERQQKFIDQTRETQSKSLGNIYKNAETAGQETDMRDASNAQNLNWIVWADEATLIATVKKVRESNNSLTDAEIVKQAATLLADRQLPGSAPGARPSSVDQWSQYVPQTPIDVAAEAESAEQILAPIPAEMEAWEQLAQTELSPEKVSATVAAIGEQGRKIEAALQELEGIKKLDNRYKYNDQYDVDSTIAALRKARTQVAQAYNHFKKLNTENETSTREAQMTALNTIQARAQEQGITTNPGLFGSSVTLQQFLLEESKRSGLDPRMVFDHFGLEYSGFLPDIMEMKTPPTGTTHPLNRP